MLDIRLIREQPEFVKHEIAKKHIDTGPIDEIVRLDAERRELLTATELLRAERNAGSRETGKINAGPEREAHITRMRALGNQIQEMERDLTLIDRDLDARLLEVPNLPDADVPEGKNEHENVVTETWGTPREFDFKPKPHWELGEDLGIIDFERAVKISGARFYMLKGAGAKLQRALISWFLDLHVNEHGFTEVYPPALVREPALVGTGQLPKFGEDQFRDEEAGLWLIPTAEVPVTNMYANEILSADDLPIYHCAYTPCFRREHFSAGRDVRGIKRVHQFDKVEMVKFTDQESSGDELKSLLQAAARPLQLLNIPYRHLQICTGDLSFVAANKVDLEAWAPGAEEWLEVSSCSNFRDFQARRANIRYRPDDGSRTRFVHTLNGSGLALPRTYIAIMENYQEEDGSITIPEVLLPYMGGLERITAQG